jgi:transcriptional regulator with XRE-family HTH domain
MQYLVIAILSLFCDKLSHMYGNKIRLIRIARGLVQENVAEQLGVAQNTYSKIETNQCKITESQLVQLAKIFGVNKEDLTSMEPIIMNFHHSDHSFGGFNVTNNAEQNLEFIKQLSAQLKEKDSQIKEKDKQLIEKDKQIEKLLALISKK